MITDRQFADMAVQAETVTTWPFAGQLFHALSFTTDFLDGRPSEITIACRGSESFLDWIDDGDVIDPGTFSHPDFGPIHAGFDRSTNESFPAILAAVGGRVVNLTGHSKGGAEAEMLALKLAAAGVKIGRVVTFGAPRWTMIPAKLATIFASISGVAYRHFKDRVTEIPLWPMDHPPTRQPVEIGDGTFCDLLDVAGMHHMTGYIASLPADPL